MIRGGYWGGSWGLSWAGAWGEAWLLLNQPYQELSLKGQVFVRSYLTRIHSAEVAEQIVSVAALNNISVLDAEVVVAAKQTVTPVEAVRLSRTSADQLFATSQTQRVESWLVQDNVVVSSDVARMFASSVPLRIAVKSNL